MEILIELIDFIVSKDWLFYCFIYSVLFWTYKLVKLLNWFFKRLEGLSLSDSKDRLSIPKIEFVRQVIDWCVENLGLPPKTNQLPGITLRYYEHKSWGGLYSPSSKEIIVYWNSHDSLLSIINTVIHEYQHFLDLQTGKDDKAYTREMEKVGYYKNIFERRARKVARKYEKSCFTAMKGKGII